MNAALPFALLLAATGASAPAAEIIKPGYWESTNRMLSPVESTKVEKRCITPAEVAKFVEGPSNRHYTCTYPTKVFQRGKITLKGYCEGKDGQRIEVAGSGVYSPTSFSLSATVATDFIGIPITGKVSTDAHRLGDACPSPQPPAEPPPEPPSTAAAAEPAAEAPTEPPADAPAQAPSEAPAEAK